MSGATEGRTQPAQVRRTSGPREAVGGGRAAPGRRNTVQAQGDCAGYQQAGQQPIVGARRGQIGPAHRRSHKTCSRAAAPPYGRLPDSVAVPLSVARRCVTSGGWWSYWCVNVVLRGAQSASRQGTARRREGGRQGKRVVKVCWRKVLRKPPEKISARRLRFRLKARLIQRRRGVPAGRGTRLRRRRSGRLCRTPSP